MQFLILATKLLGFRPAESRLRGRGRNRSLVGDLFDFAWKANSKNLELYRSSVSGTRETRHDWAFVALILLGVGLAVAIPILLAIWVLQAIF